MGCVLCVFAKSGRKWTFLTRSFFLCARLLLATARNVDDSIVLKMCRANECEKWALYCIKLRVTLLWRIWCGRCENSIWRQKRRDLISSRAKVSQMVLAVCSSSCMPWFILAIQFYLWSLVGLSVMNKTTFGFCFDFLGILYSFHYFGVFEESRILINCLLPHACMAKYEFFGQW